MSKKKKAVSPADWKNQSWEALAAQLGDEVLWLDENGPDGTWIGVRVGPENRPVILFAHVDDEGGYEEVLGRKEDYLNAYREFFHIE